MGQSDDQRGTNRHRRGVPVVLVVVALLTAACASVAQVETATGNTTLTEDRLVEAEPPTTPPTSGPATTTPPTEVDPEHPEEFHPEPPASAPPEPRTEPVPAEAPSASHYDVDDALLLDSEAPPPWESQWRNLDKFSYDPGTPQGSCPDFWLVSQADTGPGGEAMWWQDGGNLVHSVIWSDVAAASAVIDATRNLPGKCPGISWGEGGDTEVRELDLTFSTPVDVDVANIEFRESDDQVSWLSIARRGATLSVLRMPLWKVDGEFVITDPNDFARIASQAADRLGRAGIAVPRPPSPATPTTATPYTTTLPPLPSQSTTTTTTVADRSPGTFGYIVLGAMLPTSAELPDLYAGPLQQIPGGEVESTEVRECAVARAFNDLTLWLVAERSYSPDRENPELIGQRSYHAAIGRAPSADSAQQMLDDLLEDAACLDSLYHEADLGVTYDTEPIHLAGADGAVTIEVSSNLGDSDVFVVARTGEIVFIASAPGFIPAIAITAATAAKVTRDD